ncbi:uncharacterized protein HMPREF1541_01988 [Cyphellophora europaea CBS 101466]|uniref:Gfo/Idh/MocA-like oxidoreductase N-terminal domain-containing protein n=1 Tax=Cyphellophora europaea (strain CBS 101466) TaxID=1220924 RepID=W2S2K8_CYPE1|nr:uncharacterized protein HMPREF1541_01988 [Cyphellophora europaea CBS 101466]ETN42830.1 hypothetical protein HMPREF1541_01988 [Cyphellophora europaea CBS 101466]
MSDADSQTITVPVILNGVTGRMGTNQHLIRSILAIISAGGVPFLAPATNTTATSSDPSPHSTTIMPRPILVGRSEGKLAALAAAHGLTEYTTELRPLLEQLASDAHAHAHAVYFDASSTAARFEAVKMALQVGSGGMHVYAEKPLAGSVAECVELGRLAAERGRRNGVVQDKLFLPGLRKLRGLLEEGVLGRVMSVRGEFGYTVFSGLEGEGEGEGEEGRVPQRPSWNYKREEGGGIIRDMLCHWQYLIEGLFGRIKAVSCLGATHVKQRVDEEGRTYEATADDAAYATFELEDGVVVHFNSSWCVRVRRDDLLSIQVDGTKGSAVVGLRECWVQSAKETPRIVWNPDVPPVEDYWKGWQQVESKDDEEVNAFRAQWEQFLRHVVAGTEWQHGFDQGARGVLVTETAERSWRERRWVDVPEL